MKHGVNIEKFNIAEFEGNALMKKIRMQILSTRLKWSTRLELSVMLYSMHGSGELSYIFPAYPAIIWRFFLEGKLTLFEAFLHQTN